MHSYVIKLVCNDIHGAGSCWHMCVRHIVSIPQIILSRLATLQSAFHSAFFAGEVIRGA